MSPPQQTKVLFRYADSWLLHSVCRQKALASCTVADIARKRRLAAMLSRHTSNPGRLHIGIKTVTTASHDMLSQSLWISGPLISLQIARLYEHLVVVQVQIPHDCMCTLWAPQHCPTASPMLAGRATDSHQR